MSSRHARDLVATSQKLMDGLLDVEDSAFKLLDGGMQQVADATRERIHHAHHIGGPKLMRAALFPDDQWLAGLLLPPVGQLIAVARERAATTVGRQMGLLAQHVGPHALPTARVAKTTATEVAPEVERVVYLQATDSLMTATAPIRAAIDEQRRVWAARHEPLDALVARCCSQERVGLPGAGRGAVWGLRARLHALARAASVDTCNAVLLAGMRAWNESADTAAA